MATLTFYGARKNSGTYFQINNGTEYTTSESGGQAATYITVTPGDRIVFYAASSAEADASNIYLNDEVVATGYSISYTYIVTDDLTVYLKYRMTTSDDGNTIYVSHNIEITGPASGDPAVAGKKSTANINGIVYGITGGIALVGGVERNISEGIALVDGIEYGIILKNGATITITGNGMGQSVSIQVNGTYYSAPTTIEIDNPPVVIYAYSLMGVYLNGVNTGTNTGYAYTVRGNITVTFNNFAVYIVEE